jgi:CheY-like chemotaxis protein
MPKKVLIVDDEPFMQRLIQLHLERAGFEAITARSGQEALDFARTLRPDLVVMDVMMAGMDGLTAVQRLRADATTRNVPVIILTAKAHRLSREELAASGAAAVFTKPFSPTQLVLTIRRLLEAAS